MRMNPSDGDTNVTTRSSETESTMLSVTYPIPISLTSSMKRPEYSGPLSSSPNI